MLEIRSFGLPFPLLGLLYGEGEDAFKDEEQDGRGEVPVPRVVLDGHHPIDGHEAVNGEDQPRQDGLDRVNEGRHEDAGLCSLYFCTLTSFTAVVAGLKPTNAHTFAARQLTSVSKTV